MRPHPPTLAPRPASSSRVERAVLVTVVLGTALAYMSDDMLNLATPAVARDLDASMTEVQWILNAYYVVLVAAVLVAGAVGDRVGHRRVFARGLVAFTGGGLMCAAAPTISVLMAGRAVQGLGAAMVLTGGLALVSRLTEADRRNRVLGTFFGLTAAVPSVGPFLSGALVDLLSWRWLFVAPLVLPLAAAVVLRRGVPETERDPSRRPNVAGATVTFVTLTAVSVTLILLPSASPTQTVIAVAVALCSVGILVRVERTAADPLFPVHLFHRRAFVGGNVVWLLACLTSWGAVFFLAVMLQTVLGLRPLLAGLVLVPIYLVMMVGSPLAGRAAERVGARPLIVPGLALYTLGLWLLSELDVGSVWPQVAVALLVLSVGMATFTAPLAAMAMGALDDADQGVAAGMNQAMGQLAGLLGIVLLPTAAGLAGADLVGPQFVAGYGRALQLAAGLGILAVLIAASALPRSRPAPPHDVLARTTTQTGVEVQRGPNWWPADDTT
jgi:EmrB/QacA subfamily drug resistance transporter